MPLADVTLTLHDSTVIVIALVVAVLFLTFILLLSRTLSLWIQARVVGLDVSFLDLVFMRLRKTDARTVVHSAVRLHTAGIPQPVQLLEVHALAGGRVDAVVSALLEAHRAERTLNWDALTALDLAGKDVVRLVQRALAADARNPQRPRELDLTDAFAKP